MAGRAFSKNSRAGAGEPAQQPAGNEASITGLAPALNRQLEKLAASPLAPGLYLVSTPIGNLADISIRALFALASADIALCEDTRHSRKLLTAYGIARKLEAYHDFSAEKDRARILAALGEGKSVALISDAGTPLGRRPRLQACARRNRGRNRAYLRSRALQRALLLLSRAACLRTGSILAGSCPLKREHAAHELEAVRDVPGTLIFYESGGRLAKLARSSGNHLSRPARSRSRANSPSFTRLFCGDSPGKYFARLRKIRRQGNS